MPIKCVANFSLATNISSPLNPKRRIGGWSESLYSLQTDINFVQTLFQNWCRERAALLPIGAAITSQRYQRVSPVGASASTAVYFPGSAGTQADVPQMCLNMRAKAVGVRNVRPISFRGIPDVRVVEGEYSPSQDFEAALTVIFRRYTDFAFKGRDLDAAQAPVFTIDTNGVYFTEADNVFQVNNIVRVLKTLQSTGRVVGGRFKISVVTSPRSGTLAGWTLGDCKGGRMRVDATIYPPFLAGGIDGREITVKKVGRPTKGYRGRASRRK